MKRKYSDPLVFSNILLSGTGDIPIGKSGGGAGSNPDEGEFQDDDKKSLTVNEEYNNDLTNVGPMEFTMGSTDDSDTALPGGIPDPVITEEDILQAVIGEGTSSGEGELDN